VANGTGTPPTTSQLAGALRVHKQVITQMQAQMSALQQMVADLSSRPQSVQEEIDQIPGRRIESMLVGEVTFDVTLLGVNGPPILLPVSQDGPFVMTHYPVCMWYPSAPSSAADFGRWRPIYSWPLPTQQLGNDFIDIKYQLADAGAGRLFQNAPRAPLLSNPEALLQCAIPTLWSPNSQIAFTPFYQAITFGGSPATTQGTLHVAIPGYRIINL
jgi:hypothetical protein